MEERLKKLKKAREKGIDPYPYAFDRTHTFSEIRHCFDSLSESQEAVKCCGRILTIRGHGKTLFATLSDASGKMQIYLRQDRLGDTFESFKLFDLGDFVGITGTVFKTKTGEITVMVDAIVLLCKALRPLPEKWHGLKDVEIRYRKRYLDLIANPEVRTFFTKRTIVLDAIRMFFSGRGFIEVETPILQPIYGGGEARPFETYYKALEQDMYLRIADELYLKRLIVGGYEKVYEVCKDFRNEGIDRFHNPEFSMLEAYQAYTDYEGIMELLESLLEFLMKDVLGKENITFVEQNVTFRRPFKRLKYLDAINEKIGYDIISAPENKLNDECKKAGIDYTALSYGAKIDKLFAEHIQKKIVEPTYVVDHPKILSPFAKIHKSDERCVERFELVICGIELANAFSELNDPIEQRTRFEEQLKQRAMGLREIDEDFLEALEYGMPPTGGLGIGLDRLFMVLLNQPSIRDVILFPQLRKERQGN